MIRDNDGKNKKRGSQRRARDWKPLFLIGSWRVSGCVVIAVKGVNKGVRTNITGHFPTAGHRPMEHRMTYDSWSDGPYQPRVAKKVPQTAETDFVPVSVPSGLALSHWVRQGQEDSPKPQSCLQSLGELLGFSCHKTIIGRERVGELSTTKTQSRKKKQNQRTQTCINTAYYWDVSVLSAPTWPYQRGVAK